MAEISAWIKFEKNKDDDPRAMFMADRLGVDPLDITGRLAKVWGLADDYASGSDGFIRFCTKPMIDKLVRMDGFADAMEAARWLVVSDDGITFPNYEEHNGPNAKTRAVDAKRKGKTRKSDFCPESVRKVSDFCPDNTGQNPDRSRTEVGTDKIREDKIRKEEDEEDNVVVSSCDYDSFDVTSLDHNTSGIDPQNATDLLVSLWNDLPDTILVEKQRVSEKRRDAILRLVAEATYDPDLKPIIADIPGIIAKVKATPFVWRNESFGLASFFGTNTRGEKKLVKLMTDGYAPRDNRSRASPKTPTNEELEAKIEEARRRRQNEQH